MATPASKLSRDVFKKMVSGPKRYLPKSVSKELKAAGMSKLLYSNRISKKRALKAVRHLQEKGLMSRLKPPATVYRQAGIRQVELDEQVRSIERQKHVGANIRIDIGEEVSAEDRGESLMRYDQRSVLGKRVIDEIDRKRADREKKVKSEQDKRNTLAKNTPIKPRKSDMMPPDNLPDIDIG